IIGDCIRKGKRNSTLASLAGTFRRQGASGDVIRAALIEENRLRCDPPLDDKEVAEIAKSISRYEPAESATTPNGLNEKNFNRSDAGNAELFAALFGNRLRYDHKRQRWLLWKKHWWVADPVEEILQFAKNAARTRQRMALNVAEEDRTAAMKWALGSESHSRLTNTLNLAKAEHPIVDPGDGWDSDPWLLGVENGVVDLRTGELRDGQPEDRITMHTEALLNPAATCPRWIQFLEEIFDGDVDLIDFIHRAVGYSLSGDTSEQCLFLCYGAGANGKSVFLKTLRQMMAPYSLDTSFSTFELRARATIPADVAALQGMRLVTASETSEGTRLNEARIKALTGRDSIRARYLYQDEFNFEPTCKIWLAVNHKPVVRDDSHGFWRRVRLIPFEQRFEGDSDDRRLDEKLLAEAPGILAWAVRGCTEWQHRGLEPPERVKGATNDYKAESDPLADFLNERCTLHPEAKIQASRLHQEYQEWCDEYRLRDRDRLGPVQFGRRLTERFEKRKTSSGMVYFGVGLAETTP
ncbi:phage/plasmid primase, P4 family, partial [Thermodesulfobacteriota bacterium]